VYVKPQHLILTHDTWWMYHLMSQISTCSWHAHCSTCYYTDMSSDGTIIESNHRSKTLISNRTVIAISSSEVYDTIVTSDATLVFLHCHNFFCLRRTWHMVGAIVLNRIHGEEEWGEPDYPGSPGRLAMKPACAWSPDHQQIKAKKKTVVAGNVNDTPWLCTTTL